MAMSEAQHGNGLTLLLGNRTRSYGSLVRSPPHSPGQSPGQSPVHHHHQRRIEHIVQPGETLQGLSLKYGVSMEQIKRANRLYTNDSIFLKMSLSIPVLSDLDDRSNGRADSSEQDGEEKKDNGHTGSSSQNKQDDDDCNEQEEDEDEERASDLTPVDFMKRLDDLIHQSKQAAVRGCEEGEKRVADLEAACTGGESDRRPLTRSQSVVMSSSTTHRAKPLTVTKLTTKLKDREDEIFEL